MSVAATSPSVSLDLAGRYRAIRKRTKAIFGIVTEEAYYEQPILLRQAFDLAAGETGLTEHVLAAELAWPPARVRELLGLPDPRPALRLVP